MRGWDGTEHPVIEGVKITRSKVKPADQWCEWPRLWVDAADVAKIVRRALKEAFSLGSKGFSVTTSKYAGGSSIRVEWQDGPTVPQVDEVVQRFAGATFDGMTDMKEHKKDSLIDGIQVSWGADYVMTDRDFSDDSKAGAREELRATVEGFDARQEWVKEQDVYRLLAVRDLRGEAA